MDESCTGRWCFLELFFGSIPSVYLDIVIFIFLFMCSVAFFGFITNKLSQKWQDRINSFLGKILTLTLGIALLALLAYLLFVIITSSFQFAIKADWGDLLWRGLVYLVVGTFVMLFSALIYLYFDNQFKFLKTDIHSTKSEEIIEVVVNIGSLILLGFITMEVLN